MPSRDLKVTLIGEDRTGTAFGSANRHADGFGAKIASVGKGMALAFGGAVIAGVGGFGLALAQGARDAASYQKITDQVAQTIKSTGNAAGVSVSGLKEYAGQLESQSGVDEELILSGQNVLLTFTRIRNEAGKGNDIYNQASQAALNLSTTLGTDLVSANTLVGKALNDPLKGLTALGKAGVTFTAQQKEQIKTMVASGDIMGAQKIILGELQTEFGGAAKAAGQGLTGSIARAKDAFQDMFRNIATALLPKLADLAQFFANTLIPGIKGVYDLVIGGDFTGALRDAFGWEEDSGIVTFLFGLRDAFLAILPRIQEIASAAIPMLVGAFQTVVSVVSSVIGFFRQHENAAKALAVVVGIVATAVTAAWIAQGIVSTINAAKSVVAWFTTATAATTSATIQSRSTAQIVVGWLAASVGATVNAAKVIAAWVATKIAALASLGETIAIMALYAAQSVASAATAAAAWLAASARTVASLAVTAAGFVAQGAVMVASMAVTVASTVAGWVLMAAQSLIQAARMAVAWVIAMGPIGWVIAAVVGLVALIVANWDTVVSWTTTAWNAVTGAISAAWNWITGIVSGAVGAVRGALSAAWNWVTSATSNAWHAVTGAIGDGISAAVSFVASLPGRIMGALGNLGSLLWNAGKNMIQGLLDGAGSLLRNIGHFFLNLVPGWIRGPFEAALGIHSPSKVFAGYGQNIGQGLIDGIASMQPAVAAQMAALGDTQSFVALNGIGLGGSRAFGATAGAGSAIGSGLGGDQLMGSKRTATAPTIHIDNYNEARQSPHEIAEDLTFLARTRG